MKRKAMVAVALLDLMVPLTVHGQDRSVGEIVAEIK
jgi:hypothetical protein